MDDMVLHSFADNQVGRYYGPSSLRGSRIMRIATSLDLCPKVIGIYHTTKISCVLKVVFLQKIKKIEVLLQRIRKIKVLLQRIEKIKVLVQRIRKNEMLMQRIEKIEVLLQRIKKIEVLLQGIRRSKCCCTRIKLSSSGEDEYLVMYKMMFQ